MREIKFRFWDGQNKQIREGSPILLLDSSDGDVFETVGEGGLRVSDRNVARPQLTPMQFTGLKDKNGEEVYEGDVLKTDRSGIVQMKWDDQGCWAGTSDGYTWLVPVSSQCEVIGNIHENPELLEQAND